MFEGIADNTQLDGANQAVGGGQFNFWQVLNVLRRWWWLIGLIIVGITGAAAYTLYNATPMYKAVTTLEVKQEERNLLDISEVDRVVADQGFVDTQIELLQSRSLIKDTIESLNLLSDPFFAPQNAEPGTSLPRQKRMLIVIDAFKRNLQVSSVGRSRLIKVAFDHPNPNQAALISTALPRNYIENGNSRKSNTTVAARETLVAGLEKVRISLELAERDLVAYATENDIIIVEGDSSQGSGFLDMASLQTLTADLNQASIERVEAEKIYEQSKNLTFANELSIHPELSNLTNQSSRLNSEYLQKQSKFKPGWPEMIELKARIELIDTQLVQKRSEIMQSLRVENEDYYALALAKERDLQARVAQLKSSVIGLRDKSIDYNIKKRQVETERTQYEALLQRLKEVSVSTDLLGSNIIDIVDEAVAPRFPYKPNRKRGILLALLLSTALGAGLAYAIEMIDDHIKNPDDVKAKLNQIIMGVVPVTATPDELLSILADPQSSISEAYASLRTNLQYSGGEGGPRVIQITSTRSGEGKSVTSLGIALRFAGLEKRVLLIDADMRRPTFLKREGDSSIGVSGVLTQSCDFKNEVTSTEHDNLDLLVSGTSVPNPSELLASSKLDELLLWASENYDYVIVDSPPVLGLADAPILGAKVRATLLVVEAGSLRTPNVRASLERLAISGTKVLGVVLTKYKAQNKGYMDYYQYSYGDQAHSYSKDKGKTKVERKAKRKFDLM